ncbi:FAD-dependent oxidoreductase [Bosea sp. F3-2]|nr:FAD-dependent oxidoreductase [Bosea sp. F3-2]
MRIAMVEHHRWIPGNDPWLNAADHVYVEPEGGYLRPENCIAAQLRLAVAAGASLALDTHVREIVPHEDHVELRTDHDTIRAGRLVVSAGAWAGKLLGPTFEGLLRPTREILHWYGLDAAATPPGTTRPSSSGRQACGRASMASRPWMVRIAGAAAKKV